MEDKAAFLLMLEILKLLKDSGVNEIEALCALRASEAMVPEAGLQPKPTMTLEIP